MTETNPIEIEIDTKNVSVKAWRVVEMCKLKLFILTERYKITYKKFQIYILNVMWFFTQFLLHEINFNFDVMKIFRVLLVCSQYFTELHYVVV